MFVVCGEALMDVFSTGETPAGMTFDARVGGSPLNVAIGLRRLGQPACFLGGVSRDFLGERLMASLTVEEVDARAVWRSEAPTTISLVALNAAGLPSYAFHGEGAADRQLPLAALDALPESLSAVHVGSYAAVIQPVANTLRALVERVQGRSLVAYDPNIRLNVEPDLERWRAQLQWMLPRTQLLKISDEDLAALYLGADAATLAAQWLSQGVSLVVLTLGAEGAKAWTASQHVAVPPVQLKVVDTVGAGDTFQAALLTWLAEHDALSASALRSMNAAALNRALDFAAGAAAITCSRRGADFPRRSELS